MEKKRKKEWFTFTVERSSDLTKRKRYIVRGNKGGNQWAVKCICPGISGVKARRCTVLK